MKFFFLFAFLFLPLSLFAKWCDEGCLETKVPDPCYPFSISGDYIYVSKAKFRDNPVIEDETLQYRQIDVALAYTHPFNECYGLLFGSGYVGSRLDWEENPDFDEKLFNYVNFSLGGFTSVNPQWFWSLVFNMLIDTENLHIADYALYQGILWGKYNCYEWLKLHCGFILEVGLHKERIWPILGFEYAPYPELWKLSLVYPVDISFDWFLTPCWTVSGSVRFLRNRHRVKESEPLSRGIFEYRTTGAEFDLAYSPFPWLTVTGFVGSTFNGDLKVTDANNHDATHYKFHGSFYGGANALLNY